MRKYEGFEQGPIRPPSEAASLLIRVTRNCPWNNCVFCPVYKKEKFSIRPVEHVIKDIDEVKKHLDAILDVTDGDKNIDRSALERYLKNVSAEGMRALNAAWHWFISGMTAVFIQDANSLIIKPSDLIAILNHIKESFPFVKRITSYARSHTIVRISDEEIRSISEAGLNRIHIGLESGSDEVLGIVKKGADKNTHIRAGKRVIDAGIELSEYVMPGLGGVRLTEIHALETADALNHINPHFIRLRTFAVRNKEELYTSGGFEKCDDIMTVKEILLFIRSLSGITSILKSDHILNLFEEVEGRLPEDKDRMIYVLENFLSMNSKDQMIWRVGRRMGVFRKLSDIMIRDKRADVEKQCRKLGITEQNVDSFIEEFMSRLLY